jgi:hypothetical protein
MIIVKLTFSKLYETMVHVEWLPLVIASYLVSPIFAPRVRFLAKKHTYKNIITMSMPRV